MPEEEVIKSERIDNEDGSYIIKNIYKNTIEGYLSDISYYDTDNKLYKSINYFDENYETIHSIYKRTYHLKDDYFSETVYTKPNANMYDCLSFQTNKKGNTTFHKIYLDNNFKDLLLNYIIEVKRNGDCVIKTKYEKFNNITTYQSSIEFYNKKNLLIKGIYYKDNMFKNLLSKIENKYYKDGSYISTEINKNADYKDIKSYFDKNGQCLKTETNYLEEQGSGYLSSKVITDKNNKAIYFGYYKKRNLKELVYEIKYNYFSETNFDKMIWNGHEYTIYTYKNDKLICSKTYKDKEYKNIIEKSEYIYPKNNSYYCSQLWYYDNVSMKKYFNNSDRLSKCERYSDLEFKNLNQTNYFTYNKDDSYLIKTIYEELETNQYQTIEYYTKDRILIKKEFFDKSFNKIQATEEYYNERDKKIIKRSCEFPINNSLSHIEYYTLDNKAISAQAFSDKNFQNLYRTSNFRYTKTHEYILRQYEAPEDGILSEIEKYDLENNLIYKKQYKFKGLLSKILFWLSW